MTFEFRWYCQQAPIVVVIQVEAPDEAAAGTLAAEGLVDLAKGRRRSWSWRPGVTILPGRV